MFSNLQYRDAAQSIIAAARADGSVKILEPIEPELWQMAMAGQWGAIAGYVASPPPPEPVPDLSFGQMLIGLVAEGWITATEGRAWQFVALHEDHNFVICEQFTDFFCCWCRHQ